MDNIINADINIDLNIDIHKKLHDLIFKHPFLYNNKD